MFPIEWDLCCTDPARHVITSGEELDDLNDLSVDRDLSEIVERFSPPAPAPR